ncbi:hypothetical protein PS659_05464 [Pseudomonas fluorescens]|uniref:Uncharacterized protein n=1 Tax=Pseudomonas fluorescens TaxID=294 RepID=A0A5E6XIZ2_PSEFL|nr:hypothetical protein PS659_05464 [Pseudomonas fluorescens]
MYIGCRLAKFREHGLIITKYQLVAVSTVLEVKMNTFLLAQTLDEVQIGFVVLHAELTIRTRGANPELVGVALDAVFFKEQRDDLRCRHLLVNALIDAMAQVGESWRERQRITSQALTGITLAHPVDLPVNAAAIGVERQKRLFVQQRFQVQVGVFADQFHIKRVGRVDCLGAGKRKHLKIML